VQEDRGYDGEEVGLSTGPGGRLSTSGGPVRATRTCRLAAHDLAAELPDKLYELQRLWLTEAIRHDVLPLDDRRVERFNPDLAGRPQLVQGTSQLLLGGMGRLTEASMINVKNKPHTVTAQVEVPAREPTG
jgi:hypothetical protein